MGKVKEEGKGELVAYRDHVDKGRELLTMQVVNAHMAILNYLSKSRDHAVHQLPIPRAVHVPLHFVKIYADFSSFLHDKIVAVFFLFSIVL